MKKESHLDGIVLTTAVIIAFITSSVVLGESLPKTIVEQLPRGYVVLMHESGELNDDKRTDYLVVLRRKNESVENASSRPLLIFVQNDDGSFSPSARNDEVVFPADSGGQCDPFLDNGVGGGLAIKNHYFTIENGVACGDHWTDFITFRYDTTFKKWVFHRRIFESMVMDDDVGELVSGPREVTSGKAKPPVFFENYRVVN